MKRNRTDYDEENKNTFSTRVLLKLFDNNVVVYRIMKRHNRMKRNRNDYEEENKNYSRTRVFPKLYDNSMNRLSICIKYF